MIDPFGRRITYLRVSVTDRCDLRCVYCMAESMTFLPKADLLSLEEMDRLCSAFVRLGVRKLRFTGGEPLVRRGVVGLFQSLGRHLRSRALDELTLTTNGTQLARFADALAEAGVRRVNVSLDSLDPDRYRTLTRWGRLEQALAGIAAADAAGLEIKINAVALKDMPAGEADALIEWCGARGYDLTFIEAMPMGDTGSDYRDRFSPLDALRRDLATRWTLADTAYRSGGPARYVTIAETGRRLGFITPLSDEFCAGCNRVRVTCTGQLYTCLGREGAVDLRAPLRAAADDDALEATIRAAIDRKPQGHAFVADAAKPAVDRHMSVTGG